jgi:hypothetical protein
MKKKRTRIILIALVAVGLSVRFGLPAAINSGAQKSPPVLKTVFNTRFLVVLGMVVLVVAGAFTARRQIGMRSYTRLADRALTMDRIGNLPDGLSLSSWFRV